MNLAQLRPVMLQKYNNIAVHVYIITILPSIEDTVGSDCQLGQILDVCRPEATQLVICHIYFYGTLFSLVCDTYTCE